MNCDVEVEAIGYVSSRALEIYERAATRVYRTT